QPPAIVEPLLKRTSWPPGRIYGVRRAVTDAVAVTHGLQLVDGLNSFQFEPYVRFMRAATGCRLAGLAAAIPACASNEIDPTAYRRAVPDPFLLGLLNVEHIISPVPL